MRRTEKERKRIIKERLGIYLISLFLTSFSVDDLVGRILNSYPIYPTHWLDFGFVEKTS